VFFAGIFTAEPVLSLAVAGGGIQATVACVVLGDATLRDTAIVASDLLVTACGTDG
jgi:hypothetical protein